MGLSWPPSSGKGPTLPYEAILNDEVGRIGAPAIPESASSAGHPRLWTEEQRRRFIPSLLSGETRWCQGSASLTPARSRQHADSAIRVNDHYQVDGQKIWTSGARWADKCLLLALPIRNSIGIVASRAWCRYASQGVDIRPIVQISGDRDFAEVYFDEVLSRLRSYR